MKFSCCSEDPSSENVSSSFLSGRASCRKCLLGCSGFLTLPLCRYFLRDSGRSIVVFTFLYGVDYSSAFKPHTHTHMTSCQKSPFALVITVICTHIQISPSPPSSLKMNNKAQVSSVGAICQYVLRCLGGLFAYLLLPYTISDVHSCLCLSTAQ